MQRKLKLWISIVIGVVLVACGATNTPAGTPDSPKPSPTSERIVSPTATTGPISLSPPTSTRKPSPTQTANAVPTETPILPTPTATTAQPPASPAPSSTPSLTPAAIDLVAPTKPPTAANPMVIYETTLTVQTYGYENAFQPTAPEDDIYPYPRLDAALVTPPQPRSYKALVLENDYVAVTILPELGGRIYRWVDKISGRRLLYENPVIKPTEWGYRGWWLAAGGIEWAFPVEEHGLNEWRPWAYSISKTDSAASITVSDTEDRTGMDVGVTISLDSTSPTLTLQPWARNNTGSAHEYQYWINAMLALNGNKTSKNSDFIIPASQVLVHSTGDERLPGEWQWMSWPDYKGINLSRYETWQGWLGFFAPNVTAGFSAVYDRDVGQGVVRIMTPGWPAGTKIFGPGTLPSWLWTDDDSNYVEFWSGATATFADYATLQPGETVSWTEYWYPVHDLGGVSTANAVGALYLSAGEGTLNIGAAVIKGEARTVILWQNQSPVETWTLSLGPGQTFYTTWTTGEGGSTGLSLLDSDGNVMVQTGQVN